MLESRGQWEVEVLSLPQQNRHNAFAELPESLRRLLFFAKPDLVICMDDDKNPIKPIFAFELTKHVPARDHWMQRFVNLVGCAQESVPGVYVMPFSMPNHPRFPSNIDPFFFFAYDRIMEIHQVPFYIAEWETPDGRTPAPDRTIPSMPNHNSADLKKAFSFLNLVIDSAIRGIDFHSLMRDRLIVDLRNQIRRAGYQKTPQIKDFRRLSQNTSNNKFLSFLEVKSWTESKGLDLPTLLPDRISKRTKNLIFSPMLYGSKPPEEMRETLISRILKKGGDPYLGQPLAFDYIFCRLGPTPYERDTNIIIDLSILNFSDLAGYHREIWEKCPLQYKEISEINHIPKYTMYLTEGCPHVKKNFLRVYAFTADIIVFKDGIVYF